MALTIRNSLGSVKPHVAPVATEIDELFGLYWIWGMGGTQDHAKGLALDAMVYNSNQSQIRTAVGDAIASYMVANHKRLNVSYVIWRQRIWNAVTESPRPWLNWRRMADRGSPTANHMDHVHISFLPGGTYHPPDGATPPPAVRPWIWPSVGYGQRNNSVKIVQRALIKLGFSIPAGATGYYGPQTKAAYSAWQRSLGFSGSDADGNPGSYSLRELAEKSGFDIR